MTSSSTRSDHDLVVWRLMAGKTHPAFQCDAVDRVALRISAELTEELRTLAQQQSVSLFATLLSGWAILLGRWSGQEEMVIGPWVASDRHPEVEPQVSAVENTTYMRVRWREDMTVERLLKQVTIDEQVTCAREDMPFGEDVEDFELVRDHGSMFQLPGLLLREVRIGIAKTQFELLLSLSDDEEGLTGTLEYNAELYDRETIERVAGNFRTLLEGIVVDPDCPIHQLPLLSEAEKQRLLVQWNQTAAKYPHEKCLHELFEEQVERAPRAIALVYEGQSLTYAELNGRANQLARHLRNKGIGPDQLVAICVERSVDMVVGLLGILKAGGAYVPLDPNYPTERLQYMLRDAAPRVLLTQQQLRVKLPATKAELVALDSEWEQIAQQSATNFDAKSLGLNSRHLAYMIYTSGSTGKPKGAMNEHRALINRLQWMQDQYGLNAEDRVLQKTPFSFDVSVWEFFWTLISGAELVVARPEGHKDPAYLVKLIEEEGVTRLHFVPSMLQIFLSQHTPGRCASLRHIVCSGEELPLALQNKCLQSLPQVRLSNLYGPTEAAIDVTYWECQIDEQGGRVPIGCPIANVQMYVLDRHMQPVPIGVAGEIHIGGVGVGRGYLNRPELTAERFIADPFSADRQARLYKTGDLGRWQPDGMIEYLGRNDHQVKIRGFRIELGEIEAQLARHAQVKEAVVIAREDVPGEKRLVAYLTRHDQSNLSVEELRAYLKGGVPEHMVPSAFVMLESLPLTPNGKLDRRALPSPEIGAYTSQEYEAPHGETEEALARIWRELLHVERVGRQDNFFELGGHSLLIGQMLERLIGAGRSMAVRSVYECPRLADLACMLTSEMVGQLDVPPNRIPPDCDLITPQMLPLVKLSENHIERIVLSVPDGVRNIQDIYPLAPLQEGFLFHHLFNEQDRDVYVVTTLLSLSSHEKLKEFVTALQAVIDRHDILRTAVLWEGLPEPLQVVHRQARLPVEELTVDRGRNLTEQIKEWMKPERQRLDVRRAPLMRLQVVADEQSGQRFALLQLHHLAHDHESFETMLSEVAAFLDGRADQLPESVPYRTHVAQAIAHARTHDSEEFFRRKLWDVEQPTAPFELLEVHADGSQIEEAREELELVLAQRARAQARRLSVSSAALFHAAWAMVVSHTSGRDDVVFGTVLSGRSQGSGGGQRILGMFINTLPLRLRLQDVTARGLVQQTQQELAELLNHEQASLAMAQRCGGMVGAAPLFSSVLNYLHGAVESETEWASSDGIRVLKFQERTNYPIMLSVNDVRNGFVLTAQTDWRIDPHRMLGYMSTAMQSLVEALEQAPQTPFLSLSILSDSERHHVIELFNVTGAAYPRDKLIHELFEEQAERTPHATAVLCEGKSLTYAELNSGANQLAWYLKDRGVGPDQLVAMCIERSVEMVVGLLGILKAGGAHVPLDPSYPVERLQYMLRDASPRVLLTQERLREKLPSTTAEVITLDTDWSEIAQRPGSNRNAMTLDLRSDHLAYVIYTSGSTGQPKGVAIEHRNAVNLICWAQSAMPRHVFSRTLHSTSLNFDLSVYECFVPLALGGSIEVIKNALALVNSPAEVTLINTVPSAIKGILDSGSIPQTTRVVNLAGEALKEELVDRIFAYSSVDRVCNLYGPSETTTYSSWVSMPREGGFVASIGRPIANTKIYILDRQLQTVPIGVAGEIYIGGAGVARGYLNRPELTAERFIADPFRGDPQARMYKTGDLGRWMADGMIEYLGRNDHQVKIRGYRIEVGEIEAQLARHAQVKETVVIAREDVPGENRLVAYLTRHDQSALSVEELRTYLLAVLPEHMMPSALVMLESLPLTPSGKLDRRALPAPELGAYVSEAYEAPQGEVEEILAGIWQESLRVERVSRRDNFFKLGGHSLVATQVIVRIRSALSIEMPIKALFEFPTVEKLSAYLRREHAIYNIARDAEDIEELLEKVASMPESKVKELVRKLRMEARP